MNDWFLRRISKKDCRSGVVIRVASGRFLDGLFVVLLIGDGILRDASVGKGCFIVVVVFSMMMGGLRQPDDFGVVS